MRDQSLAVALVVALDGNMNAIQAFVVYMFMLVALLAVGLLLWFLFVADGWVLLRGPGHAPG